MIPCASALFQIDKYLLQHLQIKVEVQFPLEDSKANRVGWVEMILIKIQQENYDKVTIFINYKNKIDSSTSIYK